MKFFLDTANIGDLESSLSLGIDGVTTNPSLMSKEGLNFDTSVLSSDSSVLSGGMYKNLGQPVSVINVRECKNRDEIMKYAQHIFEICKLVNYKEPVSVEVLSTNSDSMINEAKNLVRIAKNVIIKLPITYDGLVACKTLASEGINVNLTLCFSVTQAICAARAQAAYVSPFIGRLEDVGIDGLSLLSDIKSVYDTYDSFPDASFVPPKIIAASVRSIKHVVEAAKMGIDICTISPALMKQLYLHPMTDVGLNKFLNDWSK